MTREEMRNYSLSVDDARKAVEKAAQEHETASGIVEQATNDMKQYESDYALVAQGKSKEVIDSYLGMGQSVTDYSNIVATEQQKAGQRYVDAVLALANYRASHKGELTTLEQETLAQLQQEAENAKEEADAVGVNIVDGTVEGINGKKYNLKSTITQLFNSVPDWAKTLLGIRSPSRVMRDEVGKMITAGVAVGIEEGKTEVQKAMQDMNEVLLDSEVRYLKESERIEKEKAEQELADRIKNAKDQEAVAKIYANEAKKRQEEENRAYLKGLKETADRERKIFEARQKDIENAQKAIRETFTELADAAFDSIDELEKAQTTLEDKLKGFGQLYSSSTVTFDGEEVEIVSLADMERQTQTLEGYAQALLDVKNRGSVPQEFFGVLRDLSIEDGMKFANALLMADDETFRKYINDWQKKQEASEAISRLLYADEAKEVKDEIEQSFSDFDANLETKGKENAEAWGEGFLQEVRRQIPTVLAEINSALASVVNAPQASIATGGGIPIANSTTYNTTYQLASSGETVRQQLQAIDAQETRNKLRGK